MAIWQYSFLLIPNTDFFATPNQCLLKSNHEDFDDSVYWKADQTPCKFFNDINLILPRTKSWSKDLLIYGNVESNCFEVLCKSGYVISVSFRIDFRSDYNSFLEGLIEFFILKGLILLDENLNILPLNVEVIKGTIASSPQVVKYQMLSNQ